MKAKSILWSLVIGVMVGAFSSVVGAQEQAIDEATPEQQTMMLQEFYNNNPLLIEDQQLKLQDALNFLNDNGIKYYGYNDIDQKYVHIEPHIYYEVPSPYEKGQKLCVVTMSGFPNMPDDPIDLYVFGDVKGEVHVEAYESGADRFERSLSIKGHTFYGKVKPNDTDRKHVKTSIALDSFRVQRRLNPLPTTSFFNAYVVPATSFRGKDISVHKEFQRLLDLLLKLGGREEKPEENPYEEGLRMVDRAVGEELAELHKSPEISEFKNLQAITGAMVPDIEKAKAEGDTALYNSLVDTFNTNLKRSMELQQSPAIARLNQLAKFGQILLPLLKEQQWQEANDFVVGSGMAHEFGYEPPADG